MKIITWNCNMAFRKKAEAILAYQPDILVVPECEHPDKLKFNTAMPQPTHTLWFGNNINKGLGIFSYSKYRFRLLECYNPEFRTIVPIDVTGGTKNFTLFAVWANNPQDVKFQYIGQVWKALKHYDHLLKGKRTILTGDFNSNSIWDKPRRDFNHSAVVKDLESRGIYSCYHKHGNHVQGKEQHPTLYMYRHADKPYHLDYCFASKHFSDKINSVEVGDHECWKPYSECSFNGNI